MLSAVRKDPTADQVTRDSACLPAGRFSMAGMYGRRPHRNAGGTGNSTAGIEFLRLPSGRFVPAGMQLQDAGAQDFCCAGQGNNLCGLML